MGDALQRLRDWNAEIAIVLGSGLNAVVQDPVESIAYSEFSELPKPRVRRTRRKIFALRNLGNAHDFCARPRSFVRRLSGGEVTANVRMLGHAGIKKLVVTNAAGALNQKFKPGDWMIITDHLNLTGTSPLIGLPEISRPEQRLFTAIAETFWRCRAQGRCVFASRRLRRRHWSAIRNRG